MARVALVFRTDVHVSDRSPASWKADYPSEIWSSLEQVGEIARRYKATAVLDGGDYFHVKAPTRNSHALVERTARIHHSYPCPTWCIEGNHDISYNNLSSLDRQPLGVLYAAGVFNHLRETVFEDDGVRVRVVGMPYNPARSLEELQAIRKQPGDTYLIAVVHQLASENPPQSVEDFFGEPVFRYSDLAIEGGPDAFLFGHWHRDQGIVQVGSTYFVNQGALSRGALLRENLERTPKVAVLEATPEELSITAISLRVAPASEVFDLEKKQRQEKEGAEIARFVFKLQESLQVNPDDSIEDVLNQLHFARDVRDMALDYLERARQEA